MDCSVYLGGPSQFELRGAILLYSGGQASSGTFASWHDVDGDDVGTPRLGPAVPLTTAFLRELSRGLGAMTRPEVLPENVLVRTPETLVWWRPAQRRTMFFRHDDELGAVSGRTFPQPPLLFRVTQRELWIRALADSVRPTASTALMVAPYYNVNTEGAVCQGTMHSPEEASVVAMEEWERSFFESEFTHIYGSGHFTRHPGGIAGLWSSLAGKGSFATGQLSPAGESLAQFVERER
ncbi:MAG: PRTRC system protein B [Bryobacteraceae bacterium]|nr:PRTRC system protein B [Bryobacteraceae bacterium]